MRDPIQQAVEILRQGGLVAFPTETVYGLGADASNPDALEKIFVAKGRPQNHPIIVHLPDESHLSQWARSVPESARTLAQRFWPGPLTLVLPRAPQVSDLITGGQDTVGLRVPGHPVVLELLKAFDSGIAAPSANRFGRLSPTTAEHVREELGDSVDLILDGGPCEVGIESTIVDLSSEPPVLLRPGKISKREIEDAIGQTLAARGATRAPGTLPSHYSPRTPLKIVSAAELEKCATENVAVLSFGTTMSSRWIAASRDAAEYARSLYANLRALDEMQCDVIFVERVPESEEWTAIRDRLARAAAR
ncbi:MAG TPA: L-threonylcarbamoyladenylate synthase [Burkholderiales bacterium]|nr:L-threonylcarbamoyladenylate synthase [Burkholderiales bacterium]